jgi:hypothetical protein
VRGNVWTKGVEGLFYPIYGIHVPSNK